MAGGDQGAENLREEVGRNRLPHLNLVASDDPIARLRCEITERAESIVDPAADVHQGAALRHDAAATRAAPFWLTLGLGWH